MSNWCRRQPLALAAVAAVAGIVAAERWNFGAATWTSLFLLALAGGLAAWLKSLPRIVWLLPLLFCFFGGWHQRRLAETYEHPLLNRVEAAGELAVTLQARILRAQAQPGRQTRVELQSGHVRLNASGMIFKLPCRLRARVTPQQAQQMGDQCLISGFLLPLRAAANEGEFSARDFGLRSGILAELQVVEIQAEAVPWWRSLPRRALDAAERCRAFIKARLARGLEDRADALTVIQAMALGASEDTDPRVEEAFRRSGTLHVFAVSGLHVGLICLILRQMLRPLRLSRPALVATLIPLVFAYAFITGWRPSAARAALMIALLLFAILAQRRGALLNSLGAAALLLLAWDTHALFLPGFQLSFGVLLAIALFAGRFWERMQPWVEIDPYLPATLAGGVQRLGLVTRRFVARVFGTSSAAWLGSLPLMWFHFHTVTPIALLANCLLVPAAFICLSLACASLGASLLPFGERLQTGINQVNGRLASSMLESANGFASVPGASLHVPPPARWFGQDEVEMRVLALPYGAEAALLRANGRFWMLDAGAASDYGRVVLPTLRRAGVNHLSGVFLSHADTAHVGGVEPLLRALPAASVYHPLHEPWQADSGATRMRQLLEKSAPLLPRTRFAPLTAEQSVALSEDLHPARLTVLYPSAADRHGLADDRGMVALIELGALRLLWTADAGFVTEKTLLERRVNLRCDVLLRGAHSSDFHATAAFLKAASPRLILNAGPERPPGGKAPAALREHAAHHEIHLLYLSEHGGVTLRLRDDEDRVLKVETFRSGLSFDVPLGR